MQLIALGINHKTAPVAVRERLAVPAHQAGEVARALTESPHISEAMVLSTCNRVECYVVAHPRCLARREAAAMLAERSGLAQEQIEPHLYLHSEHDALRHLFRVTSSLDSMIVGEPQITGQVKRAYQAAVDAEAVGAHLHRCLHEAFRVAKRVRMETGIGEHAVSLSFLAVELSRQIFGRLEGKQALLIGAGEMSTLAARHLHEHGLSNLVVANRSLDRARLLADELGGRAATLEQLPELLVSADIVISSTGAPEHLLRREPMQRIMRARKRRPIFLIDLAVPRDIEPEVHTLENVYLYDVDDLHRVLEENLAARQREALLAEEMVNGEVADVARRLEQLEVVPTIVALRERFHEVASGELERFMRRQGADLGPEQQRAVEAMLNRVVNKLLHQPVVQLKQAEQPERDILVQAVRALFEVDSNGQPRSLSLPSAALAPARSH